MNSKFYPYKSLFLCRSRELGEQIGLAWEHQVFLGKTPLLGLLGRPDTQAKIGQALFAISSPVSCWSLETFEEVNRREKLITIIKPNYLPLIL